MSCTIPFGVGMICLVALGAADTPGFAYNFIIDGLGVYVAVMSSLIGLMIVVYSLGYMRDYSHLGEYYFLVILFIGAMMGLVLSANLILIYIFWEITAICSWRLIGFYRDPQHLQNADTALLMTVTGSFFMLIGIEMVWRDVASHGRCFGPPAATWPRARPRWRAPLSPPTMTQLVGVKISAGSCSGTSCSSRCQTPSPAPFSVCTQRPRSRRTRNAKPRRASARSGVS